MRIALFYPKNMLASWYSLGGYRETLERMGHEVIDCALPGNHPGLKLPQIPLLRKHLPTIDDLNKCDVILSMFHEYTQLWLEDVYEEEAWLTRRKTPVIARFDESMDRLDILPPMGLPKGATAAQRVDVLKSWADAWSFPAAQDAEKYGGQWLPFGADTTMFRPFRASQDFDKPRVRRDSLLLTGEYASGCEKKYDLAFIGSMYPIRENYLQKLGEHLSGVTFTYTPAGCPIVVNDLDGVSGPETTELLADNYRKIKVFFCLPPMSHLLVCKLFEVMACGTFVMYPRLYVGGSSKNYGLFEHGKHLAYYDHGYLKSNAEQIRHYLKADEERERIAAAGCRLVHEKYTLDQMLESLLSLVPGRRAALRRQSEQVLSMITEA